VAQVRHSRNIDLNELHLWMWTLCTLLSLLCGWRNERLRRIGL